MPVSYRFLEKGSIGNIKTAKMPVIQPRSGDTSGPQQYKQPSRKGKKAWRKNVDVSEVEQGLEQLTEEIIKGYAIFPLLPLETVYA